MKNWLSFQLERYYEGRHWYQIGSFQSSRTLVDLHNLQRSCHLQCHIENPDQLGKKIELFDSDHSNHKPERMLVSA